MVARILTLVLIGLIGVVFGVVGTVAHQAMITVGELRLPWGLTVGLLGVACLVTGLRLTNATRAPAFSATLGVLAAIGLFTFESVGGSVLIPNNARGVVWVVAPVVIAAIVLAWPRLQAHGGGPAPAGREEVTG